MVKKILKILLIVIGIAATVLWYIVGIQVNTGRDSAYAFFFIPEPVIVAGVTFAVFYSCYKSRKANIAMFIIATVVAALIAAFTVYLHYAMLGSESGSFIIIALVAFVIWYAVLCINEAKLLYDMRPSGKENAAV
ncbi:MAG: hypothetical protein LUE27_03905 [Clostridia bacterium]|nr:hypothetical protein [Clostridia bacterium]